MTNEQKDWRLCAKPGCTRHKMRFRTICWQCWQEIKPQVFPIVSSKPSGVDAPWDSQIGGGPNAVEKR